MSKKSSAVGLVLLCASTAFAQQTTTITTNYTTPITITVGNNSCITNVTTTSYDGVGTLTTNGTVGTSCGGGGSTTANVIVSLSITPSTYTLGSGASAPVVSVTNNTPAATVSCSLNPTNGFSVTSASTITGTGTFTLSTPTTAGTFTFTPTCSTATPGYTVSSVSPATVSLTVNNPSSGNSGACSASQTTTLGTTTLQRQCMGSMNAMPNGGSYSGALTDFSTVLGTFPNSLYVGYTPTFTIQSGYYIALAFTPTTSGGIKFSANGSYGDGGIISLSTQPGALVSGNAGYICGMSRGGSNNITVTTTAGANCQVQIGTTYYLNLVDSDTQGNALCYASTANSCAVSKVAYTLYSSQ